MLQLRPPHTHPARRQEGGENQTMSKITPGKKRYVKRQLTNAQPTILIGKNGATPELFKEIEKQLQKETMVKVKLLKTALAEGETKQIAQNIAQQTEATLVDTRGHTFMLYKPRKK
jgi:RNA-binding protein